MYNFDPYNVLLSIATNILMTAFVLQGHIVSEECGMSVLVTLYQGTASSER